MSRVEALAGDVGARRYWRLFSDSGASAIGVVYPEGARDSLDRWNRVRVALRPRIRVPGILAESGDGVQILEDFGVRPLSKIWNDSPAERSRWLARAAECAAALATIEDPLANAPFSADFFRSEMDKSKAGFFAELAREPLSAGEEAVHDEFAGRLAEEIAAHPRAFVHRDFHLDNLFDASGEVGVIDFQDARLGPDSYDVASLAFERATLVSPDDAASSVACAAFARSRSVSDGFADRLERVSLQRGWKAAGTFARVCAAGRGEVYRPFLSAQVARVRRLLRPNGIEREFSGILRRRSVKLFGQEEVAC